MHRDSAAKSVYCNNFCSGRRWCISACLLAKSFLPLRKYQCYASRCVTSLLQGCKTSIVIVDNLLIRYHEDTFYLTVLNCNWCNFNYTSYGTLYEDYLWFVIYIAVAWYLLLVVDVVRILLETCISLVVVSQGSFHSIRCHCRIYLCDR